MIKKSLLPILFATSVFLLSSCGKTPTVYYDAAMNYLENGQYEQASKDFFRSLCEEAKTKECYRGYGIALFCEGYYEDAANAFIDALHQSNGRISEIDYDINYYLAKAYEYGGNYEEAISVYDALITLHPKESSHYFDRAVNYVKLGDIEEALEDFEVATAPTPSDYDLHIDIFFKMTDAGFEAEGAEYLQAILNDGKRKISDYDRGRMLYYLGNYADARVYLEKAKDLANADTVLMLGKTYEAVGDYNYAASLYSNCLNSKGANVAVYNQLGVCKMKSGDYESALSAFKLGLGCEDKSFKKELLYNEAVAYEYLLDFNTAYDKMREYTKLYPGDEAALHELEFLKTRKQ